MCMNCFVETLRILDKTLSLVQMKETLLARIYNAFTMLNW